MEQDKGLKGVPIFLNIYIYQLLVFFPLQSKGD